jgi:hypothetical protein
MSSPSVIAAAFTAAMSDWAHTPMEREFWREEVNRSLIDLLKAAYAAGAAGEQTFTQWLEGG